MFPPKFETERVYSRSSDGISTGFATSEINEYSINFPAATAAAQLA